MKTTTQGKALSTSVDFNSQSDPEAAKLSERYGQNLAAVSTNVREIVSGPILALAIRENV